MGRYNQFDRGATMRQRPWRIHPVWQGIGCLLMIAIPLMAYAGAVLLVELNGENHWLAVPREMARTISLPVVGDVPALYANLLVAAVLSIIGFGVLVFLYTIIYRLVGPPTLSPLDAPPMRRSGKRRR